MNSTRNLRREPRYLPYHIGKSCFSPRLNKKALYIFHGFMHPRAHTHRVFPSLAGYHTGGYVQSRPRESIFPSAIYPFGFTSQFELVRGTLNPPLCLVLSGSHHFTRHGSWSPPRRYGGFGRSVANCKLHLSSRWETRPLGGFAVKSAGRVRFKTR